MTDYSITLPSYSIGEQVYKQIPTVCAPFGATAVVIGGHKAIAAVREGRDPRQRRDHYGFCVVRR